jgi:hypothetical protein
MALSSDAAMVLYYDIAGDNADHDDWHTYEHLHERLSIPGFLRATRWVAESGGPKYMVIYEVTDTHVATSCAYLERLNNPTPWTASMMSRFRGMARGFCSCVASSGFGIGNAAVALRFTPVTGQESNVKDWFARAVLPAMSSRRGMAGIHLMAPVAPPPMTKEQALRGLDSPMTWLVLATAYDAAALGRAVTGHLEARILEKQGISPGIAVAAYALHYTVTSQEVSRTAPNPVLHPDRRQINGVRN